MKRLIKMLGVTCVAALALAAMTAAGASAATFTASATGTLTAIDTSDHVFKPDAAGSSSVTCRSAHTHGTIISTAAASQHVTVTYSECTAYGQPATVSNGTYELYASGTVDLENTITVTVPNLLCKLTVSPQSALHQATYHNKHNAGGTGVHKIEQTTSVTKIVSKGEGLCTGGTNGSYTGSSLVHRVGGGWVTYDA
jgi:hypothetical protein